MDPVLAEKLENCQTLPSLPLIAHQVIELSKRQDTSNAHIAAILERDPALAAKVVALSNSAANLSVRSIDSVQDAITRIGLDMTMTLALSFSFAKAMYGTQINTMDHGVFWKRCLLSAVLGRSLAEHTRTKKPERFFLACLIQDIGMLALNETESDRYGALYHSAEDHSELARFELSEFSADHATIGAWLLERWGMPDFYTSLVRNSHRPSSDTSSAEEKIVNFSSRLAELWLTEKPETRMKAIIADSQQCRFLKNSEIRKVLDITAEQLPALNEIFDLDIQTDFTPSKLIEDAKHQLVARNMRLMQQLNQAKTEAASAKADHEQLKKQLKRDLLTGVFNRAYLESVCSKIFSKAQQQSLSLSVMFLDIDHFKQVNDSFGHQAGDHALKHFARVLIAACGSKAYVGRYGGEEFVVLLPGLNGPKSLLMARRIRQFLQKHPLTMPSGEQLTLCASIGIASTQSGIAFSNAEQLINAADKSMYQAKAEGRDRAQLYSDLT